MQPVAKMWKPTKTGVYLLNGRSVGVFGIGSDVTTWKRQSPEDGAWSILAADWQDGPPTTKQLERWRSWAISDDTRTMAGWVVSASPVGCNINGHCMLFLGGVRKSAPIQPVSGEVLWVPLEVAK